MATASWKCNQKVLWSQICHFLNLKVLQQNKTNLLIANFYFIRYYNSDNWLIPSLKPHLLQQLLPASASALKMISSSYASMLSFNQLHSSFKKATLSLFVAFKHSLLLKFVMAQCMPKTGLFSIFNKHLMPRLNSLSRWYP